MVVGSAVLVVAAVIVGSHLAAGQGIGTSKPKFLSIDRQAFAATRGDPQTASTEFSGLPGLQGLGICAGRGFTATVSLELNGGPAEIRVGVDGRTLSPGPITVGPGVNTYVFGDRVSGGKGHTAGVEWRSLTGQPVTLDSGSLQILYAEVDTQTGCG